MFTAFYSGTDEMNDKSGIYYSGVIGKITPESYEYVFRFNLYEAKKPTKLDEVFAMPEKPEVKVPTEWLDNVEVKTYRAPPTKHVASGGNGLGKGMRQSLWDEVTNQMMMGGGIPENWTSPLSIEEADAIYEDFFNPKTGIVELREKSDDVDSVTGRNMSVISLNPEAYGEVDLDEEEDDPVGSRFTDSEHEANAETFGVEAADAKDAIDTEIGGLEGHDELLLEVIRTAYNMLGEEGRAELATKGF